MKNIYFVQTGSFYGGEISLPYAVGCIAAYAWQYKEIKSKYNLCEIVYKKVDIPEFVKTLDKPYLVAFSCYVWNFEYNKKLAAAIKRTYPDCRILFGGHSVANEDARLLAECSFIDFLIHSDGEVPFYRLLSALEAGDLSDVPSLSYRNEGKIVKNTIRYFDSSSFPSPYSAGIFDRLLADNGDKFFGIFETNRGCPFRCAYCDWGNENGRVHLFPMSRIIADIEWLAKNKISYCICADANFGMFSRDIEIAELLITNKTENGYPSKIQFCFTKNSDEHVLEINRLMNSCGLSKGATLSLQTLADAALANIGRKNITPVELKALLNKYNSAGIATYTDLILGLPGETKESFAQGLEVLLDAGQHDCINIFNCELLVNSDFGKKENMIKFAIKTAVCSINRHHSEIMADNSEEKNTVIVSNYTMSTDDWIEMNMLTACIGCFHTLGLFQCFALYLHKEYNIKYIDFYGDLLTWMKLNPESVCGKVFARLEKMLSDTVLGRGECEFSLPEYGNVNWPLEEGAFLLIIKEYGTFFDEVKAFLSRYFTDSILFEEMFLYQKNIIKLPFAKHFSFDCEYDFTGYFHNVAADISTALVKSKCSVEITPQTVQANIIKYARNVVWYGRKGGKIMYTPNVIIE